MKVALVITHILSLVFVGLIIGGISMGEVAVWSSGIVYLFLDIIVGVLLQRKLEKTKKPRLSEKFIGDERNEKDERLCVRFNTIFSGLKYKNSGARVVGDIRKDEAGEFLFDICRGMEYAPSPMALMLIYAISVEEINGKPTIVYSFACNSNMIAQNVFIFLVKVSEEKIRFFTVETSFPFALCEYSNGSHLNYGQVQLEDVPNKIKEIIKKI